MCNDYSHFHDARNCLEQAVLLQVTLSQVFAAMRQAQNQHLFQVLDWGIANAKLEEVSFAASSLCVLLCAFCPVHHLCHIG